MKIARFQRTSLIDFPGRIASVIYFQGCNRRCEYCHNPELLDITVEGSVDMQEVVTYLHGRRGLIDAVVLSGGEPTIQKDIAGLIVAFRTMGFQIGLHTNGDGMIFPKIASMCDYILLSHYTKEKIAVASEAKTLATSTVVWNKETNNWENKIEWIIKEEKHGENKRNVA
jgi:anaerobic ribonucleoside-triphosphate reductase activating protein